MSTSDQQFSGDAEGKADVCSTGEKPDPVPQQLKEVVSLMGSVSRRLEDCAVEWQSNLSRQQWRALAAPLTLETWEQSVLARTYFPDKSLDEAFQYLLLLERSFTEKMNNFVALLRGDKTSAVATAACDAQNQCPDVQLMDRCQDQSHFPLLAPPDLSLDQRIHHKVRRSRRLAIGNNAVTSVQESFADLIKAKINLDTKFLGFEAVLNGTNTALEESSCLCQICSNVLGPAGNKDNVMKTISAVKQKVQRVTRAKSKRLTKSSRSWARRKPKNDKTVSLVHIGDQAAIGSARSHKESLAE